MPSRSFSSERAFVFKLSRVRAYTPQWNQPALPSPVQPEPLAVLANHNEFSACAGLGESSGVANGSFLPSHEPRLRSRKRFLRHWPTRQALSKSLQIGLTATA